MTEKGQIDKHICFICDRAYSLFTDSGCRLTGGVETRSLRLAKMMAVTFKKVTFAIRETGLPIINKHGLSVATYSPAAISDSPNMGLAAIDADIYICFESNHITADVVRTCNIMGKTVICWATSNKDFDIDYQLCNTEKDSRSFSNRECAYCLHFADYIISQTDDQKQMLQKNHGLESTVIRNPFSCGSDHMESKSSTGNRPAVLWIGRTDKLNKRPHLLLEVAQRLPNIDFLMIMNNFDDLMFDKISHQASPNIKIIDYVDPDDMTKYFANSQVFFSTSSREYEGFPNVFLHSISHHLPIVSLDVDPDGLFSKKACGIWCNEDISCAVDAISNLISNHSLAEKLVENGIQYVKAFHDVEKVALELADFLRNIHPKKYSPEWTEYVFCSHTIRLEKEIKDMKKELREFEILLKNSSQKYEQLRSSFIIRLLKKIKKYTRIPVIS